MAETLSAISVLSRLGSAFNRCNFPSFCLKPLQVKCFECLLKGQDIIAVLPTGFGKSLLFQLLPDFLPVKADKNIVIVVCPLNSIIEDQKNYSIYSNTNIIGTPPTVSCYMFGTQRNPLC